MIFFELRQSDIHGVGVFSTCEIKKGERLPLFDDEEPVFIPEDKIHDLKIPIRLFQKYSIYYPEDKGYSSPANFNKMCVGWFLNHSDTPNAYMDENYNYFALKHIAANTEVTINYDTL